MGDLAVETNTPPGGVFLGCRSWRSAEPRAGRQGPWLCPGFPTTDPQCVNHKSPSPSASQFPHLPPGCRGDPCKVHLRLWPPGEAPLGPPAIWPSAALWSSLPPLWSPRQRRAACQARCRGLAPAHIFSATQRWLMAEPGRGPSSPAVAGSKSDKG